ncbi:MAG TPA: hypothetical protein VMF53_09770 [Alphaproteobacteria bacterium]|nr:hypothetical protein [Alphaproteobacteria bacterium]
MSVRQHDMLVIGAAVAFACLVFSDLRTGPQYTGQTCRENVEDAAQRVVERTDSEPIKNMVVKAATLCDAGKPDAANRMLDQVDHALRQASNSPG